MPTSLVVHIGTGKAGSTTIQAFCRDNRERLGALGILYPSSPGRARHDRLSMAVKSDEELAITPAWHRRDQPDPVRIRRAFRRRLNREIAESGLDRVVLSDEELFGLSGPSLERLGRLTRRIGDRVRVVVYLRRQDEHLVSRYQQGVKIGWVDRLEVWAQEDFAALYDYDARLRQHELLVAPDELVVRVFEPARFVGGTLHQDFLDAVGLAVHAPELDPAPRRNESLDAESVEFLRLLNRCRVDAEGARVGLIDNRELVSRLADAATGPVLTVPDAFRQDFMARWAAPNQRVASRFLAQDGPLFSDRTATRPTTSVQRLDPARVDHFLALGEVPEHLHDPLRDLAERESG